MKLIIQIPCFNEEDYLPVTVKELPKKIKGIDVIEYLVIDDGSTDRTDEVAKKIGVHHIIKHSKNSGLAKAFKTGLIACINLGADIIVNTDADNQYCAKDIEKLIQPILNNTSDMVIGARPINDIKQFSIMKKMLQKLGSFVVRIVSGIIVPDAPSGFRAISRNTAYHLNLFSRYTYTLETIIQAGRKGLNVTSIPVRVNIVTRPSRLYSNTFIYIWISILTIIRIFVIYKPLRFFIIVSTLFFASGIALGFRYLYFFLTGFGSGHVQSLILMIVLILIGFLLLMMGLLSDIIAVNRILLEDLQYKIRKHNNTF